jgi:amino acid adenylation domain-containing protein/thioester reductase-like protein
MEQLTEKLHPLEVDNQKHKKKYIAPNHLLPFYLANQLESPTNSYNLCFSYKLTTQNEVSLLIEKLQKLVKLKAYLRQTFTLKNDKLVGHIHANLPAEIHFFSSSILHLSTLEKALVKNQCDLRRQSLIRLNIITLTETNEYLALFNIHHILMDAYSLEQFIIDLNQLISGNTVNEDSMEAYLSQLEKELPLKKNTELPGLNDYLNSIQEIDNRMDCCNANAKMGVWHYNNLLSDLLKEKLVYISKEHNISLFNLLLLAWSIFIAKLTNQKAILVSYPVNIRTSKSVPGCFVNTVIFPLILKEKDTYLTFIHSLSDNLPFLKKLAKLKIDYVTNQGYMISFANSNFARPANLVIHNMPIIAKVYDQIGNSIISIKYKEDTNGKLAFTCDILSGIFPEYVTSSLLERFFNFLNKLLDNYDEHLSNIDSLFTGEYEQIIHQFNQTDQSSFPHNKTLVDLFEEQVKKTPENIALVFENKILTYTELNEKSNQLAHYLMEYHHAKPDELIALLLERNQDMIIAILAILKTGSAYVPLDPCYPQERINYILDDTQVTMILIDEHNYDKIASIFQQKYDEKTQKTIDVISIDKSTIHEEIAKQDKNNIITPTTNNLAYVIYTSGTTGLAKGVMIEHRSVVNTLYSLTLVYKHEAKLPSKITAFTSYAFDVSVSEFFIAFIQGDELHLLNNTLRHDITLISKYINEKKINYIYLPPVLLANLPRIKYPSLKAIIYAGEPCSSETALYWSHKTKLYNYYGPTETCIYSTGTQIREGEVNLIGKPINNTKLYVLDSTGLLQPVGIIGELYIGGQGVARGYLNNKELTKERFITNPFQTEEEKIQGNNNRLYKTGDLVRWRPDGNLEYFGRNDFQIKIRGYRIELEEIENVLIRYRDIKQAVAIVKEYNNDKHIIGYYVSSKEIDEHLIRDHLRRHLPSYMHPSIFVHLKFLPVTPNGKLDRNALPEPKFAPKISYIPPTNNKETLICDAFSRTLNISEIGIEDDFFNLGGTSILAIKLVLNLQTNFNINVADLYNLKTPKKLARDILFLKNNLRKNLEKIRTYYQLKSSISCGEERFQTKLDGYFQAIKYEEADYQKLSIANVLLTGATGFLGCNLLNALLKNTDYSVFLIIRANSDEIAFERINHKFKFYFDQNLDHLHNKRLFVYAGDIEKKDLGISKGNYEILVSQVDSIIHSAALTKHYGDYDTFYSANVQATNHLLELCEFTKLKHFHHISTRSVLSEVGLYNTNYYVFTEDDMGDNLGERSNVYVKTKYESEKIVMKYRKNGVNSNIYRVGNLAFMIQNHKGQENIEDNGFFIRINCLLKLKILSSEISREDISPVDLTAQAIVKLFDKKSTHNNIFHVFNPFICSWGEILCQESRFNISLLTIKQFITQIVRLLNSSQYQHVIELFLLHQRWLNEQFIDITKIHILQDRTHTILKQLGFEWQPINKETFINYLKREIYRAREENRYP